MAVIHDEWTSPDGNIRLILGDCLEVLPTLEAGSVDAVVTDPPYGAERKSAGIREPQWRNATAYEATDWVDNEKYIETVVVPAVRLCISLAPTAITPGFKCLGLYPHPADHIGGYYYQGQSTVTAWGAAWWQPILFYGKDPKIGKLQRDMFIGRSNSLSDRNGHPCPKELSSWSELCERMSFTGHTILDSFMGSGTTGVACIRLGRKFIGIEKEPKYYEIAKQRIKDELARFKMFEPQQADRQLELLNESG